MKLFRMLIVVAMLWALAYQSDVIRQQKELIRDLQTKPLPCAPQHNQTFDGDNL